MTTPRMGALLALGALAGLALVIALSSSASAAAVNESEPNDDPTNANLMVPGDTANGSVPQGDEDFWRVNVSTEGLLVVSIVGEGCGLARIAWEDNTTAHPIIGVDGAHGVSQFYRLIVASPTSILVEPCPDFWTGNYTFIVNLTTDFGALAGPDELELNNDIAHATDLPPDMYAEGHSGAGWGDLDFWRYNPTGAGWVEVVALGVGGDTAAGIQGWSDAAPLTAVRSVAGGYYFRVSQGQPLYIQVDDGTGDGSYSLRLRFKAALSEFSGRIDDREPNDNLSMAQPITPGVDVRIRVERTIDEVDVFRIAGRRGDFIGIRIEATIPTHDWSMEVTAVAGPLRFPAPDSSWFSPTFARSKVLLQQDGDLAFSIRLTSGEYTELVINVTRSHTTSMDDDTLALSELIRLLGPEDYALYPRYAAYEFPYSEVNLSNGDSYLFGQSLCIEVQGVSNVLTNISVEMGEVFRRPVRIEAVVVTRTASINITPFFGNPTNVWNCFFAMGLYPLYPEVYHAENFVETERASGMAAAVLVEVYRRHADNAAGQLALWSVSRMVNETVARELGADDAILAQARSILELAGALTCLNGLDDSKCRSTGPGSGLPPIACEPIVITRPRERPADQGGAGVNSSVPFLPLPPMAPEGGLAAVLAGFVGGAVAGILGTWAALGARPAQVQAMKRRVRWVGLI